MKSLALSAVFPIILNEDETKILLHLRQNTGYEDGNWDTAASGHVDANETASAAAVRECLEEIGIVVKQEDLHFTLLAHSPNRYEKAYYHIYFLVKGYEGTPTIREPEKNAELRWFDIDQLPENMVEVRRLGLEAWRRNERYLEITN